MLVTIIIPVYNVEKYLEECIDSVINQTYKNIEVILINDGSTDNSLEICNDYSLKDTRIKVLHQENKGLSYTRNIGVKYAKGDYLLFLDSDDKLYNDSVLKKFTNIVKENESDLIYGSYTSFVDEEAKHLKIKKEDKILDINNKNLESLSSKEVILKLLETNNYVSSATTKFYKLTTIKKNSIVFREGIYHEDEEWTLRILLNTKDIYIFDQKFYLRRYREDSIMTSQEDEKLLKRINDKFTIVSSVLDYINSEVEEPEIRKSIVEYFSSFIVSNLLLYTEIKNNTKSKQALKIIRDNLHLMNNLNGFENKIISMTSKMFGIKITSHLMRIYKNWIRN